MSVPLAGQLVLSGTAQQLSTQSQVQAFVIKAPASNTAAISLGSASVTTTTGHLLDPGDSLRYERVDQHGATRYSLSPADFFVCGASGDRVSWLASP